MKEKFFYYLKRINYKKLIVPFIFLFIYVCSFVFLYYKIDDKDSSNNIKEEINNDISFLTDMEEDETKYIYVDIKGEINNPGVYKLELGSRVNNLIDASGGLKKNANTRYINLSKELKDGDVIIIYSNKEIEESKEDKTIIVETPCICEEVKNDACITENNTDNTTIIDDKKNISDGKVNINTSSIEELTTLSGIGESKAKAIIEYRNKNGLFKSIEDIKNVSGISETIYSKIKENINI